MKIDENLQHASFIISITVNNMSNLPTTRQFKKLSDVCIIERGWSPRPIKEFLTNDENWINRIKIWDTKNQTKYINHTAEKIKPEWVKRSRMVYPWDFILSNSMSFGKPYIMQTSGCIHDWRLVLRPDESIDKDFMYLLLWSQFMYNKFEQTAAWTWVKNLNIGKVKIIEIPLPPIATQHKIVSILDQISLKISTNTTHIRSQLDHLDELWASSLSEVFEKWWWETKTISDISHKIQYWYTGKTIENWKVRYLRITDIQNNNVNWEMVPFVKISQEEAKKYELNIGDVVFARTGATVWKSFLINETWKDKIFASYLIRVVPNYKYLKPEFLKYFFQSWKYRSQIFADVVWAAQPNFNGKKLGQIQIPLPSLEIQTSIVSQLDEVSQTISSLRSQYTAQLQHYDELWASVLDQAFCGKLVQE